jgi:hypothetical protein
MVGKWGGGTSGSNSHYGWGELVALARTNADGFALWRPLSSTLRFSPGQRSHFIEVPLVYRADPSGARAFELGLHDPTGEAILGATTNAVITVLEALPGLAGGVDPTYQVQLDGAVERILTLEEGRAFIAGTFTNVNGRVSPGLARLQADGSVGSTFTRSQPFDGLIRSIALDPQGRLLVASTFRHVDDQWRPGLARLNTDGALDVDFAPFDDWPVHVHGNAVEVDTILILEDGSLLCGGAGPATPNLWRHFLLKLSAAGEVNTAFADRLPPHFSYQLTSLKNGNVLVYGSGLGGALVPLRPDGSIHFGCQTQRSWVARAPRVAGGWREKQSVEFQSVNDRVLLQVPGEFESLTLAAWVRVRGLDRRLNSLFMCDGLEPGTVYWLIRNDGTGIHSAICNRNAS